MSLKQTLPLAAAALALTLATACAKRQQQANYIAIGSVISGVI